MPLPSFASRIRIVHFCFDITTFLRQNPQYKYLSCFKGAFSRKSIESDKILISSYYIEQYGYRLDLNCIREYMIHHSLFKYVQVRLQAFGTHTEDVRLSLYGVIGSNVEDSSL